VEALLNERLAGLTLQEIRQTISARMVDIHGHGRLLKLVIDAKERIWREDSEATMHVAGTDHLMELPEFQDHQKLSDLIRVLEEGKVLSDFLAHASEEGLVITIGKENKIQEIMNCSVVSSSYRVGNISGAIGIIGPTRMPYSKLVSIVTYTARSITEVLSGMNSQGDSYYGEEKAPSS